MPDSVYYALTRAIDGNDLGADGGAARVDRIILLVGDVPPHDPETPSGYTLGHRGRSGDPESPSKRVFTLQIGNDPTTTAVLPGHRRHHRRAAWCRWRTPTTRSPAVLEGVILDYEGRAADLRVGRLRFCPAGTPQEGVWQPSTGNLGADPMFVAGYYLSQTAAGQARQSPAVDAGSGPAECRHQAGDRTTRTDGVDDTGTVDLGYHYAEGVTLFKLTAQVLPDPADGMVHGTITPSFALVYEGSADNVVRLEVKPRRRLEGQEVDGHGQ